MKENNLARRLREEKWHSLEEAAIFKEIQSRPDGLDDGEAAGRLRFYGPNSFGKCTCIELTVRFNQWLIALALALTVLAVMEMFKWVTGRRHVAG